MVVGGNNGCAVRGGANARTMIVTSKPLPELRMMIDEHVKLTK